MSQERVSVGCTVPGRLLRLPGAMAVGAVAVAASAAPSAGHGVGLVALATAVAVAVRASPGPVAFVALSIVGPKHRDKPF